MTEKAPKQSLEERAASAAEEVGRIATLFRRSPEYQLQDGLLEVDDEGAGLALSVQPGEIVVELKDPARIVTFKEVDYHLDADGYLTSKTIAEVSYGSKGHVHAGNTFSFDGKVLDAPGDSKPTLRRERQVLASIITAKEVVGELSGIDQSSVNS